MKSGAGGRNQTLMFDNMPKVEHNPDALEIESIA